MKRIIYITVIILILSVLLSGCADRPQEDQTQDAGQEEVTKVVATEPPVKQDDVTTTSTSSNVTSITQEDLDKLKADIENLEAEDLGGLSND